MFDGCAVLGDVGESAPGIVGVSVDRFFPALKLLGFLDDLPGSGAEESDTEPIVSLSDELTVVVEFAYEGNGTVSKRDMFAGFGAGEAPDPCTLELSLFVVGQCLGGSGIGDTLGEKIIVVSVSDGLIEYTALSDGGWQHPVVGEVHLFAVPGNRSGTGAAGVGVDSGTLRGADPADTAAGGHRGLSLYFFGVFVPFSNPELCNNGKYLFIDVLTL